MDYKLGLTQLKWHIQRNHPDSRIEFSNLEAQLLDNLRAEQDYGTTETIRADRARVVSGLNRLAFKTVGISFNDLCEHPSPSLDTSLPHQSSLLALFLQNIEHRQWRRYIPDWPKLVGRETEWKALQRHLRHCIDRGQPEQVLIRGEHGIGKTRLLAEFCEKVDQDGMAACGFANLVGTDADTVSVFSLVGQICYSPAFREAREQVLHRVRIKEELFERVIQMVSLGRELSPSIAPDLSQDGNVFQRAWWLLGVFAKEKPIVLVIDDLHYADQQVIEFLQWGETAASAGSVLLIGSFASAGTPTAIEDFYHKYRYSPIDLFHLDPSFSRILASNSLSEKPLPLDLCQIIADKSGGSPALIIELVKALQDRNLIRRDSNGNWNVHTDLQTIDNLLPNSLEDLARFRCEELGERFPGAEMDARRAAVIGEHFWLKVLRRISPDGQEGEQRLTKAVEAMKAQQLIFPLPSRYALPTDEGFRFHSTVFWQSLYKDLRLDRDKPQLHERIAELLDQLYQEPEEKHKLLFWRAWHYERARKTEKAIEVLLSAEEEAEQNAYPLRAIWFLEQLLRHLNKQPRILSDEKQADLFARIAKLYAQVGWLKNAADYYDRALQMSVKLRKHERQIDLTVKLAWVWVKQGDFEKAGQGLQKALDLCKYRKASDRMWSQVYRHLCALCLERLSVQADLDEKEEDIQQAYRYAKESQAHLARCKERGSPGIQRDRALLLNNFGRVYFYAGQYDEAHQAYEDSRRIAVDLEDRGLEAYVLNNLGGLKAKLGDPDSAIKYFEESLQITDEEDNLFLRCKSLLNLGTTLPRERHREAKQCLEEAYWIACMLSNPYLLFDTCVNLGFYYNNSRDWEQAENFFLEADRVRPNTSLAENMLAKIQQDRMGRSN
jgi:tetratricopeptide (TPR) repeat protein